MNNKESGWFKFAKKIVKIFVHRPKFIYLGEKVTAPSIVLSNHEGAIAPIKWELYADFPFRFWGTYEMTEGLKSVYRYLKNVYFYKKKHIPKFFSTIFAFFASPFVNMFYKGLKLIPTYPDLHFKRTIDKSMAQIEDGGCLIIFPEDSSDGYHTKLKHFYSGFVTFAKRSYDQGIDLPVFASYYYKKGKTFVIDKPVYFSEIYKENLSRDEIAEKFKERTNELAEMILREAKKREK